MTDDTCKNYIEDCLDILIDKMVEAAGKSKNKDANDFDKGVAMGYISTVSFLLKQADVWAIRKELKKKVRDFEPYL